jgi:hypothetical protein
MKRNRAVSAAISVVLSAVLLFLLLRQVKAGDLTRILAAVYLPALLVYAAVSLVSAGLRALRYKWLLLPLRIGWRDILLVTFVRNAFDDLLPARIGSLSYIYVLNGRLGFPFEAAASTFLVAIVFDFLTLGPFVLLALAAAGPGAAEVSAGLLISLAAGFTALTGVLVWKLEALLEWATRFLERALIHFGMERRKPAAAAVTKLKATAASLRAIPSKKAYLRVFLLSILIRLGKYASLYALLYALLRSQGLGLGDLSPGKTVLAVTGAEMTSMLPVKGLADFGTWEAAWATAFRLMRFDPRLAVLSGIGLHLITNLFEYGLGLVSLLALLAPSRRAGGRRKAPLRNPPTP